MLVSRPQYDQAFQAPLHPEWYTHPHVPIPTSGVLLLFPQVGANGCLVEAVTLVQEPGDVLDIRGQQLVLSEILDALEVTQSP